MRRIHRVCRQKHEADRKINGHLPQFQGARCGRGASSWGVCIDCSPKMVGCDVKNASVSCTMVYTKLPFKPCHPEGVSWQRMMYRMCVCSTYGAGQGHAWRLALTCQCVIVQRRNAYELVRASRFQRIRRLEAHRQAPWTRHA